MNALRNMTLQTLAMAGLLGWQVVACATERTAEGAFLVGGPLGNGVIQLEVNGKAINGGEFAHDHGDADWEFTGGGATGECGRWVSVCNPGVWW